MDSNDAKTEMNVAAEHKESGFGRTMSDLFVSLILVVMTVFFDFLAAVLTKKNEVEELSAHHEKLLEFLERPFDLWAIALTCLIGYALSLKNPNEGISPKFALLVPGLSLLVILVSLPLGTVFNTNWMKIAVPDTAGILFIVISVIYVRSRSTG